MKHLRYLLLALISTVAFGVSAERYSTGTVPNVHLTDSTRFVTNPDGILSAEAEAKANLMLQQLMQQTSAEVVCVAVDDIDSDINDFATELFRNWGIGKKDKNNGLLMLIAKDRRQVVIRTGTGVEGLLPDGLCGSIIRANITPRFREGDYDGGTLGALSDIAGILSTTDARNEIMSKYANNAGSNGEDDFDLFTFYAGICAIITLICLGLLLGVMISSRHMNRHERYLKANSLYSPLLFASFLGLGMPLLAFLPLALWRHQLRRGKRLCADCGSRMRLIDEENDNNYLNRAQDLEEEIGAVDYDVWLCPKDGSTEIIPYVQKSSGYTECPVCHARTMKVVSDRTTVYPTATRTGTRVITRRCINCGHDDTEFKTLARQAPIIVAGGNGGRGGGGGFGGGSFGGGFTAGGGASGGW